MINLVMALWTLSNDDIFENEWSPEAKQFSSAQKGYLSVDMVANISSKLYQSHMFPILLVIVSAVGLKLMLLAEKNLRQSGVFRFFAGLFSKEGEVKKDSGAGWRAGVDEDQHMKNSCSSKMMSLVRKLLNDEGSDATINIAKTVSYPRAVQRNLIKGLATYNILHNPKYKEQFAITWKFAMRHRHVRSVVFYDTVTDVLSNEHEKDADAKRTEKLRRASALPMMTRKEFEQKLEREKANKKMLKMVQDETRRRAGGMLGLVEEGDETKEGWDRDG